MRNVICLSLILCAAACAAPVQEEVSTGPGVTAEAELSSGTWPGIGQDRIYDALRCALLPMPVLGGQAGVACQVPICFGYPYYCAVSCQFATPNFWTGGYSSHTAVLSGDTTNHTRLAVWYSTGWNIDWARGITLDGLNWGGVQFDFDQRGTNSYEWKYTYAGWGSGYTSYPRSTCLIKRASNGTLTAEFSGY